MRRLSVGKEAKPDMGGVGHRPPAQIVPLSDEHREAWLHCLEEWSPEARLGRTLRAAWYERVKDRGLLVRLAIDDDGAVAGMIQGVPIELSPMLGEHLYVILCIWVHGHRKGIGPRQNRGLGSALLAAFEAEALARGARGVCAWGLKVPVWMRASWFQHRGYRTVDRDGLALLMWKRFMPDAQPPRWPPRRSPPPARDAVEVVCYNSGWCTTSNATCENARRAATAKGVRFHRVDTLERADAARAGQTDAVFIDGHQVPIGPPLSEGSLRRRMRVRAWVRGLRAVLRGAK